MGDSWARRTASPAAVLELKVREAGRVLACRLHLKEEQAQQFAAPVSKGRNSELRKLNRRPTLLTLHPHCHRRGQRASNPASNVIFVGQRSQLLLLQDL